MVHPMQEIRTLDKVSFAEIAAVCNAAFSDYFFKIVWTKEQLEDKFAHEGGRLDLSVGVFENNTLVAFILHFLNASTDGIWNYNGGTGVVPHARGKHLTSKMYDFILPKLKENHVDKMVLEVLIENIPAIKTYQRQGFNIVRELNFFKGKLNDIHNPNIDDSYKVVELKEMHWDLFQQFWDYPPTWQNSIFTMRNLQKQNVCFGVKKNDTILGYLIYNPTSTRIHQMAVDKNFRNRGVGSHLLNAIYTREKDDISCINIDSRSQAFEHFLEKRGLKKMGSQYEMELRLH